MPQLDQIDTFASQIFWLFVSFGIIYFYISRVATPKITDTMKKRQVLISSDIENAESYKNETANMTEEFEKIISEAKTKSLRIISEAADGSSKGYKEEIDKFDDKIRMELKETEEEITSQKEKVLKDLSADISSYVEEILKGLTGTKVSKKQIDKVVNG